MKVLLDFSYYLTILTNLVLSLLYFVFAKKLEKVDTWHIKITRFLCLLSYLTSIFSFYLLFGRPPIIFAKENLFFISFVIFFLSNFRHFMSEIKPYVFSIIFLVNTILIILSEFNRIGDIPITPYLKSFWLYIHAITAAFAHAAYLIATFAATYYLFKSGKGLIQDSNVLHENRIRGLVVFGFVFHTLMIVSGAIWAQKAWGRFWGWDPVEAWSLAAWLAYAAYLHVGSRKERFFKSRFLILYLAFFALLVSFWGIAYISETVHVYLRF